MTTTLPSIPKFSLILFSAILALMSLSGCGEQSREDVRTLGILIDQFRAANEEGDEQLTGGTAELGYPFILVMYEKQLDLIKEHRKIYTYKGEIKGHLDAMEEGLTEGVKTYKKWIDAGYDSKNPAPDELSAVNDFAMKLTSAETALTIKAGR